MTNSGTLEDTFILTGTGVIAGHESFTPPTITLGAGASTTVQLTATGYNNTLAERDLFGVIATSQADANVVGIDSAEIIFSREQAVDIVWIPDKQKVDQDETAYYTLVVTIQVNIATVYNLTNDLAGLNGTIEDNLLPLPAGVAVRLLVTIEAGKMSGTYSLEATADSGIVSNSDTAQLIVYETTAIALESANSSAPLHQRLLATINLCYSASFPCYCGSDGRKIKYRLPSRRLCSELSSCHKMIARYITYAHYVIKLGSEVLQ